MLPERDRNSLNSDPVAKIEYLLNYQCSEGSCILLNTTKAIARIELLNVSYDCSSIPFSVFLIRLWLQILTKLNAITTAYDRRDFMREQVCIKCNDENDLISIS